MAGIRLHHPAYANATYVVELDNRLGRVNQCPSCGTLHQNKALHLRLDHQGDVIVSPEIYETLKTRFLAGLELVNEIEKPPPLYMGAVEQLKTEILTLPLNGNGHSYYQPGKTKYQSRDTLYRPFEPIFEHNAEINDKKVTKKLKEKRSIFTFGKRK